MGRADKRSAGDDTNYARGVRAENQAAQYLEKQGYRILETRYKTKFGEIDLIVFKGEVLCFVEVKTRNTLSEALESVTPRSQKRIEQSALYFLSEYPEYSDKGMRFDVVAITSPFQITHLDNAWEARS